MKKRICMLMALAMLAGILSGCQLLCKHDWAEATCELPQTCTKCEKTEGEALGHAWAEATCVDPEICDRCGQTQGAAKGHDWAEATCEAPKTCNACALTEGEALGHTWEEATTEAPQTCSVCQATEGEPLDTDDRFTTAATKELQGKWVAYVDMDASDIGLEGYEEPVQLAMYMHFSNVGDWSLTVGLADEEAFRKALIDSTMEQTYAELAAMGLDKAMADQVMQETYGMSMEEFVGMTVESFDFNTILSTINLQLVYYVEDGKMYSAESWDSEFVPEEFEINGDVLTMKSVVDDPLVPSEWTRVVEE